MLDEKFERTVRHANFIAGLLGICSMVLVTDPIQNLFSSWYPQIAILIYIIVGCGFIYSIYLLVKLRKRDDKGVLIWARYNEDELIKEQMKTAYKLSSGTTLIITFIFMFSTFSLSHVESLTIIFAITAFSPMLYFSFIDKFYAKVS